MSFYFINEMQECIICLDVRKVSGWQFAVMYGGFQGGNMPLCTGVSEWQFAVMYGGFQGGNLP